MEIRGVWFGSIETTALIIFGGMALIVVGIYVASLLWGLKK